MWKAALSAAALVLIAVAPAGAQQQWGATTGSAPAASAPARNMTNGTARELANAHAAHSIITESHIARLRATLKLTPAQQPYWAPVEVALYELARQQARGEAAGFNARYTGYSSAVALTEAHLRRLKAIAMPLIYSLDDNQKRDAMAFGRNMGLHQLIASF
jgi:zinc resistance-associated protein